MIRKLSFFVALFLLANTCFTQDLNELLTELSKKHDLLLKN